MQGVRHRTELITDIIIKGSKCHTSTINLSLFSKLL